jgi:hypothetical protein
VNDTSNSSSAGADVASAKSSCSTAFASENEVLAESGEPGTGVSNAVESGVVFDSMPSGISESAITTMEEELEYRGHIE